MATGKKALPFWWGFVTVNDMNRLRNISPALILLVAAVCARFLPGMPANFSPVGAMGLYAGAFLPLPYAVALSLTGLFLSDAIIGFYNPIAMFFVYGGLASNALIGFVLTRRKASSTPLPILSAALLGAVVFFLLSNFGVWLSGEIYARTLDGLIACYIAAVPFFGNTLASHLVFAALLFGLHHLFPENKLHAARIPPHQL